MTEVGANRSLLGLQWVTYGGIVYLRATRLWR